jgi:NADPH:quinone reductase-like Zn-dependent oxidoreductase
MQRAEQLTALGAEDVFDRTRDDFAAHARERTDGRGMDVVFDPTGANAWPSSIASLARGGRYVTCGILTGPEVALNLAPLYSQEHEIIGSTGGTRADLARCLEAGARNALRSVIYKHFPLEDAGAALSALGDGGRLGKVLLTI